MNRKITTTLVFKKEYLNLGEDKLIDLIESLDINFLMSFSKPVKLYPIIENNELPKEALDPKVWEIPKGCYAIEEIENNNNESNKKEPTEKFIEKIHPDNYKPDKILAKLYPIIDEDEIPEEALDPKIWNIPEGYYAIYENIIK